MNLMESIIKEAKRPILEVRAVKKGLSSNIISHLNELRHHYNCHLSFKILEFPDLDTAAMKELFHEKDMLKAKRKMLDECIGQLDDFDISRDLIIVVLKDESDGRDC